MEPKKLPTIWTPRFFRTLLGISIVVYCVLSQFKAEINEAYRKMEIEQIYKEAASERSIDKDIKFIREYLNVNTEDVINSVLDSLSANHGTDTLSIKSDSAFGNNLRS